MLKKGYRLGQCLSRAEESEDRGGTW